MNSAADIGFLPGGCTVSSASPAEAVPSTRTPCSSSGSIRPWGGAPSTAWARLTPRRSLALELEVRPDVRVQAAHRPGELGGVAGRIEPAVLGGDLLGVGDAVLVLLGPLDLAGRPQVERPDEQPPARVGQVRGDLVEVLAEPIATSSASATGPESSPSSSLMIEVPVASSPAMIARSIGAAPRQRGSSDGWTFSIPPGESSSGALTIWPKAQTTSASAPDPSIAATESGLVDVGGLVDRQVELARGERRPAAGRATWPLPFFRSGGETTRAGS